MSDCRFGVSPVNYPDPDPENMGSFEADLIDRKRIVENIGVF